MSAYRLKRVNELLRRVLSEIIPKHAAEPGVLLTVTDVQVTPDLRHADVFIGLVGGTPLDQEALFDAVVEKKGIIRHLMGKRITLKWTPELRFRLDTTAESGTRLVQLLDDLESEHKAPARSPASDLEENDEPVEDVETIPDDEEHEPSDTESEADDEEEESDAPHAEPLKAPPPAKPRKKTAARTRSSAKAKIRRAPEEE